MSVPPTEVYCNPVFFKTLYIVKVGWDAVSHSNCSILIDKPVVRKVETIPNS